MALKASEQLADDDAFESEMAPEDLARLDAAIDRSDAQIERGETVPFAALIDDVRRVFARA